MAGGGRVFALAGQQVIELAAHLFHVGLSGKSAVLA